MRVNSSVWRRPRGEAQVSGRESELHQKALPYNKSLKEKFDENNRRNFMCALSLAACAGPVNFVRADGKAINPAELAQAKAICNGAAATSIRPTPGGSYVPSVNFGGGQMDEIGNNIAEARVRRAAAMGCMAQLGYIEAPRN